MASLSGYSANRADPRRLAILVGIAIAIVASLGLAVEVGYYRLGFPRRLVELLSLSMEANLPTWLSTCLLFSCGASLIRIGDASEAVRAPFVRHWRGLGVLFLYMSLDEAIEIHEYLGYLVEGHGVLYFSWVIPASLFVLAVGAAYLRFLSHLAPESRRAFVVAGVIYVSGALLCELPLGLWTERYGDDNLGYALIDFVEETFELVGAGRFLVALTAYRVPGEL